MKSSLDETGIRVKVDNDSGGIGISYEESICTLRYNGRVHGRGTGMRIFVVAWFQLFFPLLAFDNVNFAFPY